MRIPINLGVIGLKLCGQCYTNITPTLYFQIGLTDHLLVTPRTRHTLANGVTTTTETVVMGTTVDPHIGRWHQQRQDVDQTLNQCWANVVDVGPTMIPLWVNVSYWPRYIPAEALHSKQYRPRKHPYVLLACNPRSTLGLHGDITQGFLLNNLYCLECIWKIVLLDRPDWSSRNEMFQKTLPG